MTGIEIAVMVIATIVMVAAAIPVILHDERASLATVVLMVGAALLAGWAGTRTGQDSSDLLDHLDKPRLGVFLEGLTSAEGLEDDCVVLYKGDERVLGCAPRGKFFNHLSFSSRAETRPEPFETAEGNTYYLASGQTYLAPKTGVLVRVEKVRCNGVEGVIFTDPFGAELNYPCLTE